MKTRFAPTPSGYLHMGNLISFLLTHALARQFDTNILLRIDDLDQIRTRDAYLNNIFETLQFFDLKWDEGPTNLETFNDHFSQKHRQHLYQSALQHLAEQGAIYACTCSRTKLSSNINCTCLEKQLPLEMDQISWRLREVVTEKIIVTDIYKNHVHYDFPENMQHMIVRKKDGNASYQLASVVDDIHYGINLIVRGRDLLDSTIAQIFLSSLLPKNNFAHTKFVHHPLLFESNGKKMSKSDGSTSLHQLIKNNISADEILLHLSKTIGMSPPPKGREELYDYLTNQWIADMSSASA